MSKVDHAKSVSKVDHAKSVSNVDHAIEDGDDDDGSRRVRG